MPDLRQSIPSPHMTEHMKKRDQEFLLLLHARHGVDKPAEEVRGLRLGYSLYRDFAPSARLAEGARCGGLALCAKVGRTVFAPILNRAQAWSARLPVPHVFCIDAWTSTASS